jgi:hypothetical protein
MLSLFAFQAIMTVMLVSGLVWAWPKSHASEPDRAKIIADSVIAAIARLDAAPRGSGTEPTPVMQAGQAFPRGGATPPAPDTSSKDPVNGAKGAAAPNARSDSTTREQPAENSEAMRAFFIIVLCAGGLGTLFRGIGSLAWYSGTRTLLRSWLITYYAQPLKGALLGLMFYFVFKAGLFATNSSTVDSNPAGFAALAALVGMFDREATRKLKTVAESLFANADEKVDHTAPDSAAAEQTTERTGGAATGG